MPHVLAATRPMPETRWQCLDFCGRTPAAGDRVGRGSRVPQHGGSTPPNASGAMAMPQDLWHRTRASVKSPISTMTREIARPAQLRDLELSDLGPVCRIMIAKVLTALWTVAFQ